MTPHRPTRARVEAPSAAVSRAWGIATTAGGVEEAVNDGEASRSALPATQRHQLIPLTQQSGRSATAC